MHCLDGGGDRYSSDIEVFLDKHLYMQEIEKYESRMCRQKNINITWHHRHCGLEGTYSCTVQCFMFHVMNVHSCLYCNYLASTVARKICIII